ncbi:hypothetical protein H257_09718 [Aphanomyces astaci]|uniref:AI-2E family transporter n=1 Tax=Aphanomyces astaci TaxID=112090 RepID=W4GAX9_APHAT|nr:hypothetical protein H257_09718 [Aphanomyces astaci]ETV76214.1 hypothetical protein H257_09718 [Aphanomyces astaci]RHZ12996.1 hypothetical protein DYB26_002557 [Aphanomyces astaci]RQM26945.1 hypothetical protein B5M09_003662 [Aphanomyces astaci]|eukprot:XP_009834339.1 hypothetical protein H257_09718 [Aphanomyces astaci]
MSQSPNSASADLRQRGGGSQSPDGVQTAQAGSSLLPTTLLDAISDQSTLRSRLSGSTALLSKLPSKLHVGDSIPYSSLSLNVSVDDLHTPTQSSSSTTGGFGTPSSSHMSMSLPELMSTITRPMERLAFEVKGALLATGLAATCYLLNWFKVVLVPFFLAIFLMYLVDPLVEMIDVSPRYFLCICTSRGRHSRRRSRGCSRAFASLCAVSVVCTFFGLLGYITVLSVHALDVGAYQKGYNALVASIENISKQVGLPMNITVTLHENVDKVATLVLTEMMDLFSTLFVTMIYLTYFLSTRVRASDAGGVWAKIDHDIQRFVTLKCYLSLLVALLVTIAYVSLNVGLAILWGILTFIMNWIPNVGAMIASLAPLCIILISPDEIMTPMDKFLALVLPGVFHLFVGNFVEPKILGQKLEMSPVVVIISLSAWGLLWSIVGMMLSVPLTASFKIMLSHLKMWPELVALLDGTYFIRNHHHDKKKRRDEDADRVDDLHGGDHEQTYQAKDLRTDIQVSDDSDHHLIA